MMKFVLLFCGLVVVAKAASVDQVIPIVSQESDVDPSGKYHYSYESGDGTKASQDGELKTIDKEEAEVAQGNFEYKGDDGKTYSVNYVADENGYQPKGEHLPQVPALIARALAYLATAPPPKDEKY